MAIKLEITNITIYKSVQQRDNGEGERYHIYFIMQNLSYVDAYSSPTEMYN